VKWRCLRERARPQITSALPALWGDVDLSGSGRGVVVDCRDRGFAGGCWGGLGGPAIGRAKGEEMLLISRVRRNGRVDLMIVLDEISVARIKAYDPAEVIWTQLPVDYSTRSPATIAVSYATAAEQREIELLSQSDPENWKQKAFDLLSRGFKFQPEKGDHDFGPTVLGKPVEGVKH
jgi:hypothetical protein